MSSTATLSRPAREPLTRGATGKRLGKRSAIQTEEEAAEEEAEEAAAAERQEESLIKERS